MCARYAQKITAMNEMNSSSRPNDSGFLPPWLVSESDSPVSVTNFAVCVTQQQQRGFAGLSQVPSPGSYNEYSTASATLGNYYRDRSASCDGPRHGASFWPHGWPLKQSESTCLAHHFYVRDFFTWSSYSQDASSTAGPITSQGTPAGYILIQPNSGRCPKPCCSSR